MAVHQPRMRMTMTMRLARRVVGRVHMLVMLVVPVPMLVLHRLMDVQVLMLLGQMNHHARRHQRGSHEEAQIGRASCRERVLYRV